jgi:hypothetical protein
MNQATTEKLANYTRQKSEGYLKGFFLSAGVILVVTGVAKVWSGLGHTKLLADDDPIIGIKFGQLILTVGVLELAVAGICFFSKYQRLATYCVAWLATVFLAYRLGLWWIGWHRPCSCMGNLTDALHISPQLADNIMKGVLAYLLIGSYGILIWQWRQGRAQKVDPPTPAPARQEVDG